MYVTDPERIGPSDPCPGVATITARPSPSASVHVSVIGVGVAFGTVFVPSVHTGALFGGGAATIANVVGALVPVFPTLSDCCACAV